MSELLMLDDMANSVTSPLGVIRASPPVDLKMSPVSTAHRFPSGPVVIPNTALWRPFEKVVTTPDRVIRPTTGRVLRQLPAQTISVNQTFPSGPGVRSFTVPLTPLR